MAFGVHPSYDIPTMTHPDPIDYPIPVTLDVPARQLTAQTLTRARWATRAQFLALGLLAGVWGVHIPSVKAVYGLSEGALSIVLLAVALGAVVALLTAGRVVGALGAQRTSQGMALLMGASLALALQWPSWTVLLLAMVVFGSAMSLYDVAINTEGSALEAASARPIMGNLHGNFSLGGMVGAAVAGVMVQAGMSAPWQMAITGAVIAVWVTVSARAMLPTHPDSDAETDDHTSIQAQGFRRPHGTLLLLGLLAFAGMSAEGAMYDWGVLYLLQEVGLPQATAAWGYAAFAGAMAVARFGGDALRTRFAERHLLRVGGLLTAGAMGTTLISAHPLAAFAGYACAGAGLAMVVPILYNAAAQVRGHSRASAIATVSAIGYSGFLLGPPLIGSIAQLTSLSWGLALVVPMAALLAWGARHVPDRTAGAAAHPSEAEIAVRPVVDRNHEVQSQGAQ